VTTAGLLHHFESKEQLLHAVLDARDADDLAPVDITGDVIEQLEKVTDRFQRSPELMGLFTVLQTENLTPDVPLHDRFLGRYRDAIAIVTECIRRGQQAGAYRADLDPAVKAVEILGVRAPAGRRHLREPDSGALPAVDRGADGSLPRRRAGTPVRADGHRGGRGRGQALG
jgi:AcrR family transcriptional regulator